ncbi:MAG: amidohydrolase [Dehalococcoidales bacterium]
MVMAGSIFLLAGESVFREGVELVNTDELKSLVISEVDSESGRLGDLSLKIHSHPEMGFDERKAVGWLGTYLGGKGFSVENGICGLSTAFRARYGDGKPVLGIIAEYDALPGLGHACGHNIIAASAVGAAVAIRAVIDSLGGSVVVLGTPAEEMGGGKVTMLEMGAFSELDMAMMLHPGVYDIATIRALASQVLKVEFFGKAAHAAARPEAGINALEAMLQSFTAINSLRQHISDRARIHGIITDGGQAANIVPEHSAGVFIVRAESDAYLDELKQKVVNCFSGAATASGARLEYRWEKNHYATMLNNMPLACLFRRNAELLGRVMELTCPDGFVFSTDMGNVSHQIPAIHPMMAIAQDNILLHSSQFASAAASDEGKRALLDGSKSMAMTAVDLLADLDKMEEIKEGFSRQ